MANKNCYNFSGITVCVEGSFEREGDQHLSPFRVESDSPDITVSVEFEDTLPEGPETWTEKDTFWYRKVWETKPEKGSKFVALSGFCGTHCTVKTVKEYAEGYDVASVFRQMPLYHALLPFDAFILHASYLVVDGKAILFSAPSGTGKSTQAELWQKYRGAEIINGDRVLIRKTEQGFTAGGIHYAGSSGICKNKTTPIGALVLLGQATENSVGPCGGMEAFRKLFKECSYVSAFPEDPGKVANLLTKVVNEVPLVKLDCLPEESAVDTLETYLLEKIYG